jgi:glucose/arabinose dehydrogenase/azurin/HEAT repeat protein
MEAVNSYNSMKRYLIALLVGILGSAAASVSGAETLELRPGDRICIIGNSLADRMQHSGWLETLIYSKYLKNDLVFRNLGFAGDELTTRMRSENFGTPDEWLAREKADVIFAFFGFNESFKGSQGIEQFRKDLDTFITNTLKQNYSGKGAPRLVLFSPIALERHADQNFPDPAANNTNLMAYTAAMADVAKARGVPFVDLFTASQRAYSTSRQPLTVNGVHLNDEGYRVLAPVMFESVFGAPPVVAERPVTEKLRGAVNDKNEMFFKRYRTVDGYNVYGGRSALAYQPDKGNFITDRNAPEPYVSNFKVMQREMSQRDVMTANRDQRIWAVAKGGDLTVKDDNLPETIDVKSNKPGKNADGSHVFLGGEEAMQRMKIPPGCKINLFASEEQFPMLANPVQMAFDPKGRLWVAAWPNYPERTPQSKDGDKLLVFEDTDGDGKADKCTTYLDDLNCPTGFQFYKDGVIVVQAPDVWFVRDTNGDGKADWKERILNGLDSADSHHTANALALDPGGAIYLSDGVFHRTQVETAKGPVRNTDAAIYRYEPRTGKFDRYIAYDFANPHGKVFDYWGTDLVTDATGNNTYFAPAFSGHIDFPAKHPSMKQFWDRPSRPCPGTGMLSSRHFPEEFQNNFLNANVIGFQGIFRVQVSPDGSGLQGKTLEPPLVVSDDPNFRPSALDVGPDGAVYFLDWHKPIIGHMQHHLRDPNRDRTHGRVYRITYEGRPLSKPALIAGQPIEKLLDLLKEPEDGVRTRAKIELGARDSREVVGAAQKWAAQFDPQAMSDQHHLMEALWVHQWHNVVNEPLLWQMLKSPDANARAAAAHVLCYWRDRVADTMTLLLAAANDPSPRVRLEAVRAASFFTGREAIELAQEVLKYDTDYYLDYTFKETKRQLQRSPKDIVLPTHPKALARVIGDLSDSELLEAPESEAVLFARLERKGLDVNARGTAVDKLASLRKTDRVTETIAALRRLDERSGSDTVVRDLAVLLTANPADLANARETLTALSRSAAHATVRHAAWAGVVTADGKPETVWSGTAINPAARAELIDSIILLIDPTLRAAFQSQLIAVIADNTTATNVRAAALQALPLMGTENAAKNFGVLTDQLRSGRNLSVAVRSIKQLPRDSWVAAQAGPSAEAILAWAEKVPPAERTSDEFIETVQTGIDLAGLLPPTEATRVRKALLGLGVRVFAIKTIREQMRFDTPRIVVEAGKPFEIIFENNDMMPHNIVIVQPGAREEVGAQAQTMPPKPDRDGRAYVPRNDKILAASKMLEPGQRERLKLTAPQTPGDHEYVCTYPEHWKVMFGQMVVVKDIEAYLQSNPQAAVSQPATAPHKH